MGVSDRKKLMVEISKLYYYHGMSQKEIAAKMGISRGYVCQLMEQARKMGIIEIKINDLDDKEADLERHVRKLFGLRKAIICAPHLTDPRLLTTEVVDKASGYIDSIIENDMIIAFSWGSTIYQISSNMTRHTDIKNVTSIPLCGGTTNLEKKIYVSETSINIAHAYNGTPLHIPLPAVVQSTNIKKSIYRDANIRNIFNIIKNADIALFTVGSFGENNVLYQGGYIDDESLKRLIEKNAVGDLCAHFINEYGEVCDRELDDRTISIDLKHFAGIKNKICIAVGDQKVRALLGVLRKKYVDVLITDETTIQNLLKIA